MLPDSALAAGAVFVSANTGAVWRMTLVNVAASLSAFPTAVFDVPVLGRLVLRVPTLFRGLVRLCCARGVAAGCRARQPWRRQPAGMVNSAIS
ncbi:unnamed protein product [Miscanthus lutarioriparius]|uniref:Uncharacterized protein n=1 Tax=Miscanthus lutarioriparius TaxID=422564 RepID=A0A811SIK8_9POAL|nr:unnamed protein product [Miscanthus lutarioriparius]